MRRSQRIRGLLISVLAVVGLGFQASAAHAFGACSNSDLLGRYIYQFAGRTNIGTADEASIRETGIFFADGQGGLTAYAHTLQEGMEIAPPNTEAWQCEYDVAANCFVDITCDRVDFGVSGLKWSMVVEKWGQEVRFQAGGQQPPPPLVSPSPFGVVEIQGEGRR